MKGRTGCPVWLVAAAWSVVLSGTSWAEDRIVVTASPLPKSVDELNVPVTVLDRREILTRAGATLGEILADEPGIAQSSFAAGASRPIIRGLDNFRVRVQENGIGSHDASALSEDHGVAIDPLSAQRIEVVRGPATLRYGSEAIGGVVNVLNNRIPNALPSDGIAGEVHGAFTTVDDGLLGSAIIDAGLGPIAVHGDLFMRDSDSYDIPSAPGTQASTQVESFGASGGVSYIGEWGYTGLSVTHFDSEYGIPASEDPSNPLSIDLEQTKVTVAGAVDLEAGPVEKFQYAAGYTDYTHDEVDAAGVVGSRFDNEEWEARGELLHGAAGPFSAGAAGVQLRFRDLQAAGEGGELIAPNETDAYAFFLFEEVALTDRLTLKLGGRVEHVRVDGTAFDAGSVTEFAAERSFLPLSGSGGLVLSLGDDIAASVTFQAVQRAPDALELFSKGPHEATETFELGDASLDEETAFSGELGLRRESGPITFDLAAFYTYFDGFIFKRFTGETCDDDFTSCAPGPGRELTQIQFTQQDATFYGGEATARWAISELWGGTVGVDGRVDLVRAELSDDGGNVPRIPPVRWGAGVYYDSDVLSGRFGFLRFEEQTRVAENETSTAGYTDLSAQLNYAMPVPNSSVIVDFGIRAHNLLDEDARNHLSFKKEDVLLPGRNVKLTAGVRF